MAKTYPLHFRPKDGPSILSAPLNTRHVTPQWAIHALARGEAVELRYIPEYDRLDLLNGAIAILSALPGPMVVKPIAPDSPFYCLTDCPEIPFLL